MIELDWDDLQKTIIRYTFIDPWTWEEYYATNPKRDTMLSTTNQVVDIVLDFSIGRRIPGQAMTHFRKAAEWDSPQRGIVVIIGINSLLQALGNIVMTIYPQAALKAPRPAKNFDEARRIIAQVRLQRAKNIPFYSLITTPKHSHCKQGISILAPFDPKLEEDSFTSFTKR